MNKTICVFCGASAQVDDVYKDIASEAGRFCAAQGWDVVYGGASGGLMGIMATAALENGARVVGVLPRCLEQKERAHKGLSELIIADSLHERQRLMADRADGFIVLPGGLGTLAEFFEVVTWKQIGLHDKPIALVNAGGYWDGLLGSLELMEGQGFLHLPSGRLFEVCDNIGSILKILRFS